LSYFLFVVYRYRIHLLNAQVGFLFLLGHLARDAIEIGDFRSPISHLSNLHQIVSSLFQLRFLLSVFPVDICQILLLGFRITDQNSIVLGPIVKSVFSFFMYNSDWIFWWCRIPTFAIWLDSGFHLSVAYVPSLQIKNEFVGFLCMLTDNFLRGIYCFCAMYGLIAHPWTIWCPKSMEWKW